LGFENLEDLFRSIHQVANDLEIYRPNGTPRPPEESPLLLTLRDVETVLNKKTGEKYIENTIHGYYSTPRMGGTGPSEAPGIGGNSIRRWKGNIGAGDGTHGTGARE
jgi:hypothetical protein